MFYNIQSTVWARMHEIHLTRGIENIVLCPDRDSAEVVAQNIRDNIETEDHIQTGRMLEQTRIRKAGDEWAVRSTDYAKYVNGNSGFIDDAVNSAVLDGYEGEIVI